MELTSYLKPFLVGEELFDKLVSLPDYDPDIRTKSMAERIMFSADLFKVFVPNEMTQEIYTKLYKMVYLSLTKKQTIESTKATLGNQLYMQDNDINKLPGVITGLSSTTIIGPSGVGKSAAVLKAMQMVGDTFTVDKPYLKIIPCLLVQTPFDCSYKTLLLEILSAVDEKLGTKYAEHSSKSSATANQMLGMVSQVCQNYIGVLIIDEIQNIVEHKAGRQLYRLILQLINTSCNVVMVGTPECINFFTQNKDTFQFARRSVGLQYSTLPFDNYFEKLVKVLLSFNYLQNDIDCSHTLINTLYQCCDGNISVLVSLVQATQEEAILNGTETFDEKAVIKAFRSKFQMLHEYLQLQKVKTSKKSSSFPYADVECNETSEKENKDRLPHFTDLLKQAKKDKTSSLQMYKKYYSIETVKVC